MTCVEKADALLAATENYVCLIHFYAKERGRLKGSALNVIAVAVLDALDDLEKIKAEVSGT
jgi:hypothetical protein